MDPTRRYASWFGLSVSRTIGAMTAESAIMTQYVDSPSQGVQPVALLDFLVQFHDTTTLSGRLIIAIVVIVWARSSGNILERNLVSRSELDELVAHVVTGFDLASGSIDPSLTGMRLTFIHADLLILGPTMIKGQASHVHLHHVPVQQVDHRQGPGRVADVVGIAHDPNSSTGFGVMPSRIRA